ncbi:MAG: adenylate/guanylate cyclase domain-containing protein [Gaiellaceae bacterium]
MSTHAASFDGPAIARRRALIWVIGLALPLALVALLRVVPTINERWEDTPAHFWIVFLAAAANGAFAVGVSEAGRRRRDARLTLIGLAFFVSAGFLGLHALATPGQILAGKSLGFVIATPVGLVAAGAFAALSAVEYRLSTSLRIVRGSRVALVLALAVMGVWAGVSLAQLPPLTHAVGPERLSGPLGAVAAIGVILYGYSSISYFRIWLRRGSRLAFAVAFAFALLAEALIVSVVSLPTSWQLSWWEWHALMAIGFLAIGVATLSEWREERFSSLYLDETAAGSREVTVLFADLAGFTPFSETHDAAEVHAMLVAYFSALTPLISGTFGGEIQQFVGDQIFAIWNKGGDQPDHAVRAARAALALHQTAESVRAAHPDWPRFRAGVNTGLVLAGLVGGHGHRAHGVFGDTVNLGSRLEGHAPVGGVLIGAETFSRLPDGTRADLVPELRVKGKAEPVSAYVLHQVP